MIAKRGRNYVPLLESSGYSAKKFLGRGIYGSVYQCTRLDTKESVAVKAISKHYKRFGQNEVDKLEKLRELDQDMDNFIKFYRHFEREGHIFIEFENLDRSVDELMDRLNRALRLSEIQVITQQMLEALYTLKNIRMAHTDIKLDNIMLINHQLQPFKVKLIDFGLARYVSEMRIGDIIVPLAYRPPEVLLGLPLNEAVDMWALGCIMATMYINGNLYLGESELEIMKDIVQLLGQPADHLLNAGIYTKYYFDRDSPSSSWGLKKHSLKSLSENRSESANYCFSSFHDITMTRPGTTEREDTQVFVSLLKQMLHVDPGQRITPWEALRHPFITLKNFPSDIIHFNDTSEHGEEYGAAAAAPFAGRISDWDQVNPDGATTRLIEVKGKLQSHVSQQNDPEETGPLPNENPPSTACLGGCLSRCTNDGLSAAAYPNPASRVSDLDQISTHGVATPLIEVRSGVSRDISLQEDLSVYEETNAKPSTSEETITFYSNDSLAATSDRSAAISDIGPQRNASDTTVETLPDSASCFSDWVRISTDEEPTHTKEVKIQKNINRIHSFVFRLLRKGASPNRVGDAAAYEEVAPSTHEKPPPTDDGATHSIEVKTKKAFFTGIHKLISRLFRKKATSNRVGHSAAGGETAPDEGTQVKTKEKCFKKLCRFLF